jgi:phosphatidylglycerol:prolipoprotein diacylglycerol transferase
MQPPDDPVAFIIPIVERVVYWYGIFIVAGMTLAAWVAGKEAERRGMNPEHAWGALVPMLIFGLIGARLYHVLTPPPSMVAAGLTTLHYLTNPADLIAVDKGGLGLPGALLGGLFGAWLYFRYELHLFTEEHRFRLQRRRERLDLLEWLDLGAMVVPLGQAIGRWGNFFNQELYGAPTTLPWGLKIDCNHRVAPYTCDNPAYGENQVFFHPTFLYESLWNFATFGLLFYLNRRYRDRLLRGELLNLYFILYPIGRFLIELVRLDSAQLGATALNVNQLFAAVVAVGATIVLIARRRRLARQTVESSPSLRSGRAVGSEQATD